MLTALQQLTARLRNAIRRHLATEVSAEEEFCIFHCRRSQCDRQHWQQCPRRLRHLEQLSPQNRD